MKEKITQLYPLILILCFGVSCNKKTNNIPTNEKKIEIKNTIPVYNFNELEPLLYTTNNTTYIINFWAMWCAPCIKELPYLQKYANENAPVELLLISLDFPKDIETKLKPFLRKNNISAKVILLDDPDANTWINKINPNWSGAIPYTIIFNNKKRFFYERSFENLNDLENKIHKNLDI